nr:MAG TPA: hypothetical protein [Caudoviricetes sp.]
MNYKEEIIKKVNSIESSAMLKYIYAVITTYLKSRGF